MNFIKLILQLLQSLIGKQSSAQNIQKNENEGGQSMNNNFNQALQLVLQFEGGYVNNPNDSGGATNKGITQRTYDAYRQSKGLSTQSVQNIADNEVTDIYYNNFWLVAKCDQLPAGLDALHFDTAVNAGPGQAAKFLQRAVGVTADGVIGNQTLAKVNASDSKTVIRSYITNRVNFYIDLVIQNNSQLQFLKSWLGRTLSFS
jgi:lysozyme family protein